MFKEEIWHPVVYEVCVCCVVILTDRCIMFFCKTCLKVGILHSELEVKSEVGALWFEQGN